MAGDANTLRGSGAHTLRGIAAVGGLPDEDRFYLLVFEGDTSKMHELPRDGELLIGRADTCGLVLADQQVSRKHAKVTMENGIAQISDLESANGTSVNGERLATPRVLESGDVVAVCSATLHFHSNVRKAAARPLLDPAQLRRRAEEETERALKFGRSLSVVVFNLGTDSNRALVPIILAGKVRSTDVIGWGGADHLVMLLCETDEDEAREIAVQLMTSLQKIAPDARAGLVVSADTGDVDTLLANARAAAALGNAGAVSTAPQTARTLAVGDLTVIVADAAMTRLYALLERLAPSDIPVLILGETGTGKEVASSALHRWSKRADHPLVTVNCAAIPDNLVESELFGHEKGAFTGANTAKVGLLEAADGGTVFFDELGELPAAAQAKLLRVLESRRIMRVGDVKERDVDIRIVAATNRDLKEEVKAGRFRQDLYFRLSGASVWLPPLRDRVGEIPVMAHAFLAEACARAGRPPMTISGDAMHELAKHAWPGNIRELRNVMQLIAATAPSSIVEVEHLTELGAFSEQGPARALAKADPAPTGFRPIDEEVRELERKRMAEALDAAGGNQRKAAALISMPLRTFVTKLKLYNLR